MAYRKSTRAAGRPSSSMPGRSMPTPSMPAPAPRPTVPSRGTNLSSQLERSYARGWDAARRRFGR